MLVEILCCVGGGYCEAKNFFLKQLTTVLPEIKIPLNSWKGVISSNFVFAQGKELFVLGTPRFNPLEKKETREKLIENLGNFRGVIIVGGDDTLKVAEYIHEQGYPVIGIPATIDNNLNVECCLGYDSAVEKGTEIAQKILRLAIAHRRHYFLEVLGRRQGWIAYGIAKNLNFPVILGELPESKEMTFELIKTKEFSVTIVAENFTETEIESEKIPRDEIGNPLMRAFQISQKIAQEFHEKGLETRALQVGDILRIHLSRLDREISLILTEEIRRKIFQNDLGFVLEVSQNLKEIRKRDFSEVLKEKFVPSELVEKHFEKIEKMMRNEKWKDKND